MTMLRRHAALGIPALCGLAVLLTLAWDNGLFDPPHAAHGAGTRVDPVCRMEISPGIDASYGGRTYSFCAERCRQTFLAQPTAFASNPCPVCSSAGADATPNQGRAEFTAHWQGNAYQLCSADHLAAFRADPAGVFMHTMWGIPGWLYYSGVGLILVMSFGVIERRRSALASPGGVDLLAWRPLKRALVHPATRFVARSGVVLMFLLIIAAGLFGNQIPSKNIAPILTWTVWWGGLILLILYFGKAWCYVCPWDALSDWAEGLRFWGAKKEGVSLGLKWPKALRSIWPATLLFVGLTWIEIGFGVTMKPRATAWLALAMLGMAFVSAFLFDKRSFCRYGCLVGRISGLYALFLPVEVRAADPDVCKSCRTKSCLHGNDRGEPCPTQQYLGSMEQNTYCITCMECVKSCEMDNVSLRLRPWGRDLVSTVKPRSDEAYLALVMLALTGFHGLTMTRIWRRGVDWLETAGGLGETATFSLSMAAILVLPVLLYAGLVFASRAFSRTGGVGYREVFIRYAYALLPIALFYHLAHNSEHLLMEGQKVLALASDPFGWGWDLLGTADWKLPPLVTLPTLWGIQVFLVAVGHVYSLWVSQKTAVSLFGDAKIAPQKPDSDAGGDDPVQP